MSVAYILNPTYSYVNNSKLNPELEVGTSIKAPVHYVDTLSISKNESGNMELSAPVVECTQIDASIGVINTVSVETLIPSAGIGETLTVDGSIDVSDNQLLNVSKLTISSGAPQAGYVLSSTDVDGTLAWVPDATGSTPALSQVLAVGNSAGSNNINMNNNDLTGANNVSSDKLTVNNLYALATTPNAPIFCNTGLNMNNNNVDNVRNISSSGIATDSIGSTSGGSITITSPEAHSGNNITGVGNLNAVNVYASGLVSAVGQVKGRTIKSDEEAKDDAFSNKASTFTVKSTGQLSAFTGAFSSGLNVTTGITNLGAGNVYMGGNNTIVDGTTGSIETTGDISCNKLTYVTLDPAVPVPTLADVLTSGNTANKDIDMDGNSITNADTVYTNSTITGSMNVKTGSIIVASIDGDGAFDCTSVTTNGNVNIESNDGQKVYSLVVGNSTAEPAFSSLIITPPETYGYVSIMNSGNLELVGDGSVFIPTGAIQTNLYQSLDRSFQIETIPSTMRSTTGMRISGFGTYNGVVVESRPQKEYWVSPSGSDAVGVVGSLLAPFLSIQHAIDVAEASYDGTYPIINVLEGSYPDALTIHKKVILKGQGVDADSCTVGCVITGDITILFNTGTNGDMFNQQVIFSGFLITGSITSDTVSSPINHILNLVNCYIYNSSGGHTINFSPSCADGRLFLDGCQITNTNTSTGTNELVTISVGMIKARLCAFQNANLGSVLKFGGSSRCDAITLCTFTNGSSSASVAPLVEINSTPGNAYTFGNCAFVYAGSTSKTGNINACGIRTTSQSVVTILYNTFVLNGTSSWNGTSGNYIMRDLAGTSTTLFFSNSAGYNSNLTPQTSLIGGTKLSFQAVA